MSNRQAKEYQYEIPADDEDDYDVDEQDQADEGDQNQNMEDQVAEPVPRHGHPRNAGAHAGDENSQPQHYLRQGEDGQRDQQTSNAPAGSSAYLMQVASGVGQQNQQQDF